MERIRRALWHIESNLTGDEMSMDDVARAAGVSRFHLSRLFASATGLSAVGYTRKRRLSEAAKALAAGAPDILGVALDYGYASHEAFTRAFKDEFGVTPESVRTRGDTNDLKLQESMRMTGQTMPDLEPPRFENGPTFLFAGINQRYAAGGGIAAIPLQWQRFIPFYGSVPHTVGENTYGVIHSFDHDGAFSYLAGVEVSRFNDMPPEFETIRVPARRYAVFTHRGHISAFPGTMTAIWSKWVPEQDTKPADAPSIERYDERFNPETGEGEVEIWIPIGDEI